MADKDKDLSRISPARKSPHSLFYEPPEAEPEKKDHARTAAFMATLGSIGTFVLIMFFVAVSAFVLNQLGCEAVDPGWFDRTYHP